LTNNTSKTALVLTPTRELAEQVSEVILQLSGGSHNLRHALLIGGVGMDKQVDAIRKGARLFIGTPGRINDHIGQQTLNLSRMGFLVLDEADRMLDMGFAPQLDRMRKWMTAPRQTMLFSATIPPDIEKMASLYLKDPIRVTVGTNSRPVERIKQQVLKTSQGRKYDNLVAEVKRREGIVLIFARTQHGVDQLAQKLKGQEIDVTQIHGGMEQEQRRAALDAFKSGQARVLVATDVAARGLDVHNISHVINYDLPYEP
jgi:superfamily II DNA/RNA helicase